MRKSNCKFCLGLALLAISAECSGGALAADVIAEKCNGSALAADAIDGKRSGGALAADNFADITTNRFPDANLVVLDEAERVRYHPDGTFEQHEESWKKLLTEQGRRSENVISLEYSRRYGEASIDYVGVIGPDGSEREIDVSATTREATDNSSTSSNIYDPLDRTIVCTVPGLSVGDILHVRTTRLGLKPRCEGKWSDISLLEWTHPILRSTYEVTAPPELPLRQVAVRNPLGNVVTNVTRLADGSLVHTFVATNSPQAFAEPAAPPLYAQLQNVRVSTARDWPEISRWYWNLCEPHLARTNPAMTNKVNELKRDLRAIFRFVSQEVRYMGLTMEDSSPGYSPHDVNLTFDNRYGVCRDKAALLVAMLRIAGFRSYPVLIHVDAKLDPVVPQPFFNHAIVAVDESKPGEQPRYRLMDPTNESTRDPLPSYLDNCSYLVAHPRGERLATSPVTAPDDNAMTVTSSGTLQRDGSIFLQNNLVFAGINDVIFRHAMVRRQPAERVKIFEKAVQMLVSGAELVSCDIEPKDMRDTEKPLTVRLVSRLPGMRLDGETRSQLNVPMISKVLGAVRYSLDDNLTLERRRFPLKVGSTAAEREHLTLLLDEFADSTPELPPTVDDDSSPLHYCRSFAFTNGVLTAERKLSLQSVEISPEEYLRLKATIKAIEVEERRRPSFVRDPDQGADVRWILNSCEASVQSDRAWVVTNTVVKQVLSYAGKKQSAELKFNFNRAMERIGVMYATVSNRNGEVHAFTGAEANVLDADWAASAPRYPAGSQLVISLPSVEIGSVISYQVVREVFNAPAPFYRTFAFDTIDPVDRMVARVDDWCREVTNLKRRPDESNQPRSFFWRDCETISYDDWRKAADRLMPATQLGCTIYVPAAGDSVTSIRNWLVRNVKIAGPAVNDLPIECQITMPNVVLDEGYAGRLDYTRLLCALLCGAGFKADVVFAAPDGSELPEYRRFIIRDRPNSHAFSIPLCRVDGAYIGIENEYGPVGPSAFFGCDCFDPATGRFEIIQPRNPDDLPREEERSEYVVAADGSVTLSVDNAVYGTEVAELRKRFAEIVPEERRRLHSSLLNAIAENAEPIGELETDLESYPYRQHLACRVKGMATKSGDTLSLRIAPLASSLPTLVGRSRRSPFALDSADAQFERVTVKFPKGYDLAECLPEPFRLTNPLDPQEVWLENSVSCETIDGALVVTLTRQVHYRPYRCFPPQFHELLKNYRESAISDRSRTITVRRSDH